jgi:hypothetical protein
MAWLLYKILDFCTRLALAVISMDYPAHFCGE